MRRPSHRLAALAAAVLVAVSAAGCQTATLLPDGRVLLVAGNSAEIVDAIAGTRTKIAAPAVQRVAHAATLLDDGDVLLTGGTTGEALVTGAELVHPDGTITAAGDLVTPRLMHTATRLADGRVLIAGGGVQSKDGSSLVSMVDAELYDPATGTFSATGPLATARSLHTATLLADGSVLLVGGAIGETTVATMERYDPAAGTFTEAGTLPEGRGFHSATALPDGRILIAGGEVMKGKGKKAEGVPVATTLFLDPVTGATTPGPQLVTARAAHAAATLPDGRIVLVGGIGTGEDPITSVEIVDPVAGTATAAAPLPTALILPSAAALPDGTVLIAGIDQGKDGSDPTFVVGRYDVAAGTFTPIAE